MEARRRDPPSGMRREIEGYWLLGNKLLYQSVLREALAADLVIVEHANRYLMNHILLMLSALGLKKVAFWDHAGDRGPKASVLYGWFKKPTLK